jgi:CheY-like chemotaxis protein
LLVMVVDDSVTVRKVTSRLLERHGMNVLTAKDGVDAMALLEEHRPDCAAGHRDAAHGRLRGGDAHPP